MFLLERRSLLALPRKDQDDATARAAAIAVGPVRDARQEFPLCGFIADFQLHFPKSIEEGQIRAF